MDRGRARMVAGLANHRRIEIIRLLIRTPSLCVNEVAAVCDIDQSTAVEHVKRLHESQGVCRDHRRDLENLKVTYGLIAISSYISRFGFWFLGMDQAGGLPLYGNAEVLLGPFAQ